MACEYREDYWKEFAGLFKEASLRIEGVPQDIVNTLVGTIGEQTAEWIDRPLPLLDNETARSLVKTEEGCKALKVFITRMPR